MARNINKRLEQLKTRRQGMDRLMALDESSQRQVIANSILSESWQKRSERPYTRYALGAMQEVGPDYTRISIETAERVGKQLRDGLASLSMPVDFRLQGSVPLNVHIRGVSDVDLLTLDSNFLIYDRTGPLGLAGSYTPVPTTRTSISVISALRTECEKILKAKYPAATVDTSGGKAIAIYGGSLARPVDVVPSHWYDTAAYQTSRQEHDRAVTLLNKKVPETIDNWPFLHIKNVHDRDVATQGGLKKAIRLCKNVKNDAETEGKTINFPSFDIAATMYHGNLTNLRQSVFSELGILAEAQRHLDWLSNNMSEAAKLRTPDGSRLIFDSQDKLNALRTLSLELDDLAREVANEQNPFISFDQSALTDVRKAIASAYVPAA